jgi:sugar lactone lactonase YvrE
VRIRCPSQPIDNKGYFYIQDDLNGRIRKVDTNGIISTFCGDGVEGYFGENVPATNAEYSHGMRIHMYAFNLYIPDALNRRIRKIDIGDTINTIAGTGIEGYTGDNGQATAAELGTPVGITFDKWGNLYYADESYCVIRKIDTLGVITTVAGNGAPGGYSGNGGRADSAKLQYPVDVAVDLIGNIYIAELGNNIIRKVDTNGLISTYAGTGEFGYTGDNAAATNATFNFPEGITVDGAGNVYVADEENNVIRKIDTSGIISTVVGNGHNAGTGDGGFLGDGGPATAAELNNPTSVALDKDGNLFIADLYNNRIRKVTNIGVPLRLSEIQRTEHEINIYPNPTSHYLTLSGIKGFEISITNILGLEMLHFLAAEDKHIIDISTWAKGVYILNCFNKQSGESLVKRLVVRNKIYN